MHGDTTVLSDVNVPAVQSVIMSLEVVIVYQAIGAPHASKVIFVLSLYLIIDYNVCQW